MIHRVLAAVSFLAMLAFSQSTAPASVDVGEEPKHHLAFENEYVRAFEVEVPVGTETLIHRHTKPYMYVSIGDADVRNEVVGKDPVTIHPKDGEVKFVEGGFAHKAVNVGKTEFRNVTVELLKSRELNQSTLMDQLAIGYGHVSKTVGPGWIAESWTLPSHVSAPVPNNKRNYAVIAISDLDLTTTAERLSSPLIKMRAGEVKWFAGGVAQEWRNSAATPARYVILSMMPAAGKQ